MATPKIQIDLEASAGLSGLRAVGKELEGVTAKAKEAAKELQNVTSAASGQGDGQSWRTKTGEDAKNSYYKAGNVTYSVQKMSDVMNWYKDQGEPSTTEQSSGLSSEDASQLEKDTTEFNQSFEKVQKKGIFRKLADTFKHMAEEFNEGRKEAREEWAAKRAASGSASASGSGKGENSAGGMAAAKKSSEELNKSLQKTNATMKKAGETSAKSSTAFKHLGNAAKAAAKGVKALTSACAVVAGVVSGLIAVFAGLAVALAGPVAILAKFNERMGEAQKYRLALGDLTNEQKRVENQMQALGYVSDELHDKWLDLQIELDKLHWTNQYLTDDDIKIEEGIKNIKLAIGSITGTIVDWIGTMISDLFPSLEDLQSWLLEYIAPAIASVVTVFQNFTTVLQAVGLSIAAFVEEGIAKISDFVRTIVSYITWGATSAWKIWTNLGKNLGALLFNVGNNIVLKVVETVSNIKTTLTAGLNNTFKDVWQIIQNFGHNLFEFIKAIGKTFMDIPANMKKAGQNLIQIFKNVFELIKNMFSKLEWSDFLSGKMFTKAGREELFGKMLPSEKEIAETMGKGLQSTNFTEHFRNANYVGLYSNTGMYDEHGNLREGYIDADAEKERKRKEREKKGWRYREWNEDMVAWNDGVEKYKRPKKSKFHDYAKQDLEAAATLWSEVDKSYEANLGKTRAFMKKNFRKEGERLGDNEVRPLSPAELLKLFEGSSKAQTEGLTSAYDRINNAVSNKNPMVDLLKKQIEAQKQAAEQQKKANEKQAEAAEKQTEHNSVVEEKVSGIYNWLTTGNAKSPSPAAVVEG